MANSYRVVLSDDKRAELRTLIGRGMVPARQLTRARFLLKADYDAAIAGALDINPSAVLRVRRQFTEQGLTATLARKRPDRVYERSLDGNAEVRLIATACSTPPDGAGHWSLRLLADELVQLEVMETISHETVRQTIKNRSEAVANRAVVHRADSRSGLRDEHGRRGGVCPAVHPTCSKQCVAGIRHHGQCVFLVSLPPEARHVDTARATPRH